MAPRNHEYAVTAVVDRARKSWRRRDVGLDDLQHKQAVFPDEAGVDGLAFEVGAALLNRRTFTTGKSTFRKDFMIVWSHRPVSLRFLEVHELRAFGHLLADREVERLAAGRPSAP